MILTFWKRKRNKSSGVSIFFVGGFTEDAQQRNFLSCHSHAKAVDNSKLEFKVILCSEGSLPVLLHATLCMFVCIDLTNKSSND